MKLTLCLLLLTCSTVFAQSPICTVIDHPGGSYYVAQCGEQKYYVSDVYKWPEAMRWPTLDKNLVPEVGMVFKGRIEAPFQFVTPVKIVNYPTPWPRMWWER